MRQSPWLRPVVAPPPRIVEIAAATEDDAVPNRSTLTRRVLAVLCLVMVLLGPVSHALAEDDQFAKIATMSMADLDKFVGLVTASVGQDTLKLRGAAERHDCLELTRSANSFALGYRYLARVDELIRDKADATTISLRSKVVQSRVVTFAARVRAEELLGQGCASFVAPAEHAGDERYVTPQMIALTEFTTAVIEARQTGEIIFAGASGAAKSGKCTLVGSAIQSIQLITPYLVKLLNDIASRPQALGPRASRRGLAQIRDQLASAANQLDQKFAPLCSGPAGGKTPAGAAPKP